MKTIRFRGRKYGWRPEKMHGAILITGAVLSTLTAAFSLYCVLVLMLTIW